MDRFHCTTRSPQHQLRTFAQDCMCLCTSNTHTHTHTHTHTRYTLSDSPHRHIYMIKMHKTVNSTVVLQQREGAHAWRYIHACHSKHTICTVHLQFCKLHDHNLCTVRVADSAIKPYAYTTTFNDCMIKTFLFSYTVCRGHKLTNSTCTHTQTHTTQRHNYHKFQEQHTSANHSATGTSSDNVTNTYSESRPKGTGSLTLPSLLGWN